MDSAARQNDAVRVKNPTMQTDPRSKSDAAAEYCTTISYGID